MRMTIYVYSAVNFFILGNFAFVSVFGLMVMYAINEVVTRAGKQKLPAIKNELQHIQVNLHLHKNFFYSISLAHGIRPLLHISTPKCFSSLIMSINKKYGKRRSCVIIPAYVIEQNRTKIQSNTNRSIGFGNRT